MTKRSVANFPECNNSQKLGMGPFITWGMGAVNATMHFHCVLHTPKKGGGGRSR